MIDVRKELEVLGLAFEPVAENEVKCLCPFHNDKTPSCFIHTERGVYKCHACQANGDFITFVARVVGRPRADVYAELADKYDLRTEKTVDANRVEAMYDRLKQNQELLEELHRRAVTPELIRKYRLGMHNKRVAIPIKTRRGEIVNLRLYQPGAAAYKMLNLRGYGKPPRLFPIEQMDYETIVLCGGELKAIVAADQLNEHNIGAVTITAGEGAWYPALTEAFRDKVVYICFDIDEAGQRASASIANVLYFVAREVRIIKLPLDPEEHPKGDVNDFVADGGHMWQVVKHHSREEAWHPITAAAPANEPPTVTSLAESIKAPMAGRRLTFKATVVSKDTAPYILPTTVSVRCNRDQKFCALCPVQNARDFTVQTESSVLITLTGAGPLKSKIALQAALGIPSRCRVCELEPKEYATGEDTRLSSEILATSTVEDRQMVPAIVMTEQPLELNETYELTGRMYPNPDSNQAHLVISTAAPAKDALSSYQVERFGLEIFKPEALTKPAIITRLMAIYDDLEANVTHIYQRRLMHALMDLTWHSPLWLQFDGNLVKGWLETLVVGDSSQGKSDTAEYLRRHFDLGQTMSCKNATVAGLLGGLQSHGNRWFVSWGMLPTCDRRLAILEELKGASAEVIGRLTDTRSRGIAELMMIEKRRAYARTRILAISNCRGNRKIRTYNYGISAVEHLIGSPEDVRRFDWAICVAEGEIPAARLNMLRVSRPKVPHVYTSDLCKRLILWAWTQNAAKFTPQAEAAALEASTRLCDTYCEDIPLMDAGSGRYKVARIAAAIAARTFSCDDAGDLLVHACHVEVAEHILNKVYGSSTVGYSEYTKSRRVRDAISDPKYVAHHINQLPYPHEFVEHIVEASTFDLQDMTDWLGTDRDTAQRFMSLLVRKRCVSRRGSHGYVKTQAFSTFLAELSLAEMPDHIKQEPEF